MIRIAEPTFLITFDTELLWGIRFMGWSPEDEAAALRTRDTVMPAILQTLDEFAIPATFAIVGHLLVAPEEAAYPDLPADATDARTWYEAIAGDTARFADGFHWPNLPDLLATAQTRHEIALHSFSHWHFESLATTRDIARFEITANRAALERAGLAASGSLVFPRNAPGQLAALSQVGVGAYRALDPNWYGGLSGQLSKLGHVADCLLSWPPPVTTNLAMEDGVLVIPGSYLLWSTEGFRRRIPQSCRVRQVRKGLQLAQRQTALFHLWMHPINLAHHPDLMLPTLRTCLEAAATLRDSGQLRVMTMSEVTAAYWAATEVSDAR